MSNRPNSSACSKRCLAKSRFARQRASLPKLPAPGDATPTGWRTVVAGTRLFLVFLRSIPEYVWTYLLLGMVGISAWPAVLALAIHNAGILGKLNGEVIENMETHRLQTLRGAGATRSQIVLYGVYPGALGRFLLYFFYRWETCVREATVLGLLGFAGLGYHVIHSYAAMRYDEMLLFVLLGSLLIFAGDLVSAGARLLVRREGG